MTRWIFNILISAVVAMLIAIAACSPAGSDRPVVTVSIPPQKYIVDRIAGGRVEVRSLLSAGANPESYEPSMAHLMNLERSSLYLRMGNLGFEDAIITKVRMSRPDLEIVDMAQGVDLIYGTHRPHGLPAPPPPGAPDTTKPDDDGHRHDHPHPRLPDPHTWSSTASARVMAANALQALTSLDPSGEKTYEDNYHAFINHLDSLDRVITGILRTAPQPPTFLIWHPSLSYFARDYGVRQIPLGSDNKELATTELRERIDSARRAGPLTMLLQRDFDTRQAEVLNQEIGAQIIYINPLNEDWEAELLHTARAIAGQEK